MLEINQKKWVGVRAAILGVIVLTGACVTSGQTDQRAITSAIPEAAPQSEAGSYGTQLPPAPDRDAILETVDRFFEALATGDARAIDILVVQESLSVTAFPEEPGRPVRYSRTRSISEDMRAGGFPKIEEPYWNPIILQRKNLAVVWAPYEVWLNDRLAHCGIDVFNMTRHKTAWRIDSIHWTQERTACEELWPDGRSVLRPGMFNDPAK